MSNRTALVTGGSRGIGAAITATLRGYGLTVLTPTRAELDLSSNTSIDSYLQALDVPVDIIVNNAGINRLATSLELTDSDLQDMLQINLVGPLRLVRGLVPQMQARRYGRIINISSIFSVVSKLRRVPYTMSKSGLNGLTTALAVELGQYNILVNAVAPGFINTALTRQNNSPAEIEAICKTIPMQRMAEAEEIAELVAFLCSEKNSYITGQLIIADGGFTCM